MKKVILINKLGYTQKECKNYIVAVEAATVKSLSKRDLKRIKDILAKAKIVRCGSYDDFVDNINKDEITFLESKMLSIKVRAPKLFEEANNILLGSYGGWTKRLDLSKPAYYAGYEPNFFEQCLGTYIGYTSLENSNSYVRFNEGEKISNCKKYKLV